MLASKLSFPPQSNIASQFELLGSEQAIVLLSFHPHLLLAALLNEAEDDVDGVLGLLEHGLVQHVVPLPAPVR